MSLEGDGNPCLSSIRFKGSSLFLSFSLLYSLFCDQEQKTTTQVDQQTYKKTAIFFSVIPEISWMHFPESRRLLMVLMYSFSLIPFDRQRDCFCIHIAFLSLFTWCSIDIKGYRMKDSYPNIYSRIRKTAKYKKVIFPWRAPWITTER